MTCGWKKSLIISCAVVLGFVMLIPVGAVMDTQPISPPESQAALLQVPAVVEIEETPGEKSVEYRWYDMFNVSYGEHMYIRQSLYPDEQIVSDVYPNYLLYSGEPAGNTRYYTNMRLNITARNLTEISMDGNPWFFPLMGSARGGTAVLDWDLYYPTWEEVNSTWGPPIQDFYDGWLCTLRGEIRLDQEAAMAVFDISPIQFADFDLWWATNSALVSSTWLSWLVDQGRHPYDIWCAYEYIVNFMGFRLDAVKSGDQVILSLDSASWGIETLMTRWLRYSFMGTEWWLDDFHMDAVIGSDSADIDIETVVANSVFAYTSVESGEPCWVWQGMLGDILPSSLGHPALPGDHVSDFDPYADDGYIILSPGNYYYDTLVNYDYTPGVQNLSANERLMFEWPAGVQTFKVHSSPGVVTDEYAHMNVFYSEPMILDVPGQIVNDELARTIAFYGPLDFWSWSRDQSAHTFLADEWDRMGILPYGMPRIEFAMAPPLVADAGDNQTVFLGDVVTLDGSGSQSYFQPDNFTWTFIYEGNEVLLYGVQPTFRFITPGLYEITLNVTDALGRYDTDVVWIQVDLWVPEFGGAAVTLVLASCLALILVVRTRRRP